MKRIRSFGLFLVTVLGAVPVLSQAPVEGPNVFGDLSEARASVISESRRPAYEEVSAHGTAFDSPDIATALSFPSYLIAIAKITAVHLPNESNSLAGTRITFHVEQYLRGESEVTDFDVVSKWTPHSPLKEGISIDYGGSMQTTALDRSEPKKGDRYILGYTLAYGDGKTVFVPSAIDLQDPSQARLIGDVKQFLTLESTAACSCFEPYLAELDSAVPWIREIAIQRLTASEACNASAVCGQRFSEVVRRQIQSKIPNERLEASGWLVWIESVSRSESPQKKWPEGLPVLPDSAIRQLLTSAIEVSNVYIGDVAFERREMFDFNRAGKPGECIEIVPALRKSAHWLPGEHDYSGKNELLPPGFGLSYTTSCIPAQESQGR